MAPPERSAAEAQVPVTTLGRKQGLLPTCAFFGLEVSWVNVIAPCKGRTGDTRSPVALGERLPRAREDPQGDPKRRVKGEAGKGLRGTQEPTRLIPVCFFLQICPSNKGLQPWPPWPAFRPRLLLEVGKGP